MTTSSVNFTDFVSYEWQNLGEWWNRFYFYYTDDTYFINNTIVNAISADTGGAIYTYEDGNGNTLQISNCTFSNCRGKHGSIIYIIGLKSDINIEKSTFTDCKNFENDGNFIRIGTKKDNKITFTECNFVYLESCSSCGGTGITNDDVTTDTFIRCVFKHINHNHNGGAIYFNSNDKYLRINKCYFEQTNNFP